MTFLKKEMLVAALVLGSTGPVWATNNHGHAEETASQSETTGMAASGMSGAGTSNMMGRDHHEEMMPMMHAMMQMHLGDMAQPGMGRARGIGMDMMDRDMMGMMTQGVTSDEPMDMMMRSQMGEFDGNDDGALSLGEFESLHSAMLRDLMVDRFQHLDADGDGMISEAELEGAGSRMDALRGMGTDNN
jgi:hypothetical protein